MKHSKTKLPVISDRLWLSACVAIGAVVRFYNIAKNSVWHDEGFTMMLAPQSPAQIILRTGRDVHPPLYYLTLHYWLRLFGTSEVAARSLSAVLMLVTIVIMFALVRRLFGGGAARYTALFLALGPFVVRYSQEARMYGMLAFIAALATYLLIRAQDSNQWGDWLLYGLAVTAGLYTYYYVIFMIAFHWFYIGVVSIWPNFNWKQVRANILNPKWIAANALAVILFVPWLPTAYSQFTRVQGGYWIPQVSGNTIPQTLAQFTTFTDLGALDLATSPSRFVPSIGLRTLLLAGFILLLLAYLVRERRRDFTKVMLMAAFMGLTPAAVFILSLRGHPIYVDRYFVFAAVAFYALLGIMLWRAWPWENRPRLRQTSALVIAAVFLVGIGNVYHQATHQMRAIGSYLDQKVDGGDALISGDFYTFFDGSYYNHTPVALQAYVPDSFPGCCEGRSLLYDHPELILKSYADLHPASGKIWIIGHSGQQDYFTKIPNNWQPGESFTAGDLAVHQYQLR